jgi:Holliday junction DNA helicase RuvA
MSLWPAAGGVGVITQVRGILRVVEEESLTLAMEAGLELEILIPDYARRQLQGKLGEMVALHTIFDLEGNQMAGRFRPRLLGFLTPVDREFFETFCSVDGVGVRKALRAMVRPVREMATLIQEQDLRMLATLPGIGEATAERIVAKLRRKVGKFALMIGSTAAPDDDPAHAGKAPKGSNGTPPAAEPDVLRDTYAALLSVGHNEAQARQMIDRALSGKKRYKSVADMIDAIYQLQKPAE